MTQEQTKDIKAKAKRIEEIEIEIAALDEQCRLLRKAQNSQTLIGCLSRQKIKLNNELMMMDYRSAKTPK